MNALQINQTVTHTPMLFTAIMDELEYRNYVSHRVRNISFERMAGWNFFHNIEVMEQRYQAASDREQAIELFIV